MRYVLIVLTAALLTGAPSWGAWSATPAESSLEVTNDGDNVVLTVPVSKLVLTFPRGGLVPVDVPRSGATASPRYFHFRDTTKGLVISGWFESASSWQGFQKFVVGELIALKKSGFPPNKAPEPVIAGQWQAFSYDVDLPKGNSSHVRAELVESGTWVDLHISVSGDGPAGEMQNEAVQFLKSIVVKVKS